MSVYVSARDAYGTTLDLSTSGYAGTFTTGVFGITALTMPGITRGTVDVSNWGTTDAYKQVIGSGIAKTGEITLSAVYLSSTTQSGFTAATLRTEMESGTKMGYKIVVAGTSSMNCYYGDCYLTSIGLETPFDDKVTMSISMKPTGRPIIASTTS